MIVFVNKVYLDFGNRVASSFTLTFVRAELTFHFLKKKKLALYYSPC